ncbi:hypothetical protein ACRQU7_17650 [Caproiciproducens sp. R1]|uniref:hypothetical protein n=1 Tax=Caproiciproducens sp. R1 TaxID=3435000 RepID=UPI004033ADBE
MPDYQKMYHSLFNDVTDAIAKLQQAQQKTEEMYMDSKETVLTPFLKKRVRNRKMTGTRPRQGKSRPLTMNGDGAVSP